MRKTVSFILVLCLLIGCMTIGVSAADEGAAGNNSRYTGLVSLSAGVNISNLGRLVANVEVITRSGYTTDLNIILYQYDGFSFMTNVKEWNYNMTTNTGGGWSGVWYVEKGYLYYIDVTATIYDSNGRYVETVYLESNTEYY